MFRQKSVPVINDLLDKIFALNISAEWIFGISMQSYNSYQSKANICSLLIIPQTCVVDEKIASLKI